MYCNASSNETYFGSWSNVSSPVENSTDVFVEDFVQKKEPNTALLSAVLMFGTFFIAYFLRLFRNSKYLGRTVSQRQIEI